MTTTIDTHRALGVTTSRDSDRRQLTRRRTTTLIARLAVVAALASGPLLVAGTGEAAASATFRTVLSCHWEDEFFDIDKSVRSTGYGPSAVASRKDAFRKNQAQVPLGSHNTGCRTISVDRVD